MPRRYKKFRARKGAVVYDKPSKTPHVTLACEASGCYRRPTPDIPSCGFKMGINTSVKQEVLTAEMKERELVARAEAERRKKMIAPMYNKGAYQYIGGVSEEILHDIGKKK